LSRTPTTCPYNHYPPITPRPPTTTLFPYTTLFRSGRAPGGRARLPLPRRATGTKPLAAARQVAARDPALYPARLPLDRRGRGGEDRKSTRLNSSHVAISYAVFCLKKKKCGYRIDEM